MLHPGIFRITLPIALLLLVCAQPHLNIAARVGNHLPNRGTRVAAESSANKQDLTRTPNQANHRRIANQDVRRSEVPAADELFDEGKKLAAKWDEKSLRMAIDKLSEARSLWHSQNFSVGEIKALTAMAEIFINLSEFQNALKALNEGLELKPTSADRVKLLNGLSSTNIYLGNEKKARTHAERANQLSRLTNDRAGQAESLVNMAEVYYFVGDNQRALETLERALVLWPDQSWPIRARALMDKGYVNFDLRQMDQALDFYQQALTQSRSNGNRRGEALALTAIGAVFSFLGNKLTAMEYQNNAVALFREIGDRNGEGVALNGLGYVYRNLGEHQKSLDCYLQALQIFQMLGSREYETFALNRVGTAYEALGDRTKALEYYRMVLKRAVVYSLGKAHTLNSIGVILESMGQPAAALDHFNQALHLFKVNGDRMGEAASLNSLGKVYASLSKPSKAAMSFQEALAISRAVRDRRGEVSVLFNIAQSQRDAKDYDGARQSIEDSLKTIELLRTEVAATSLRTSYFASVRQHYGLYIDILMELHKAHPERNFAEMALAASEKARARLLLELLVEAQASIRQGVEPDLIQKEAEIQKVLSAKAERHLQLVASKQTEAAKALAKEIDQLSIRYDELEAEIRRSSPRFAALTQPEPIPLGQIQRDVLDANSLLLEYYLGEEKSYLWAVSQSEVRSYELPARSEIEAAARQVYSLLTSNQPIVGEPLEQRDVRIAAAKNKLPVQIENLSKILIGPVAGNLRNQRLLIVPDGALQYIPFQVLVKPASGGREAETSSERSPLFATHEIVNEPSISVLGLIRAEANTRKPKQNSVAVIADPVFESDDPRIGPGPGFSGSTASTAPLRNDDTQRALRDVGMEKDGIRISRLLSSHDEAEAIISAAPWWSAFKATGLEASRATAMNPELGSYRFIHFATHGLLNDEHPELSGIVLSLVDKKGQPQDGFLRLQDIYNLHLPVDLVVLSACNTGLGKEVSGEGLIGLTRGFMYAGASSVVASLWKVDDEATAELMNLFYVAMFNEGLSPAAALRKAQLEMSQQKRWQSPYYWSAFIIQGQYSQTQRPTYFSFNKLSVFLPLAAILMVSAFFLWKRRRHNFI